MCNSCTIYGILSDELLSISKFLVILFLTKRETRCLRTYLENKGTKEKTWVDSIYYFCCITDICIGSVSCESWKY